MWVLCCQELGLSGVSFYWASTQGSFVITKSWPLNTMERETEPPLGEVTLFPVADLWSETLFPAWSSLFCSVLVFNEGFRRRGLAERAKQWNKVLESWCKFHVVFWEISSMSGKSLAGSFGNRWSIWKHFQGSWVPHHFWLWVPISWFLFWDQKIWLTPLGSHLCPGDHSLSPTWCEGRGVPQRQLEDLLSKEGELVIGHGNPGVCHR